MIYQNLLFEKLKEEHIIGQKMTFPDEKIYMRDLKQLLDNVPPYAQVKKEALAALMPYGLRE